MNEVNPVHIMLVKAKSINHLDDCEGCIFYNNEEEIDCSLIGSPMSCVVDMHYNYVWKKVVEPNGKG